MTEPNDRLVAVDIAGIDVVTGVGRGGARFGRRPRGSGELGDRVAALVVRELVAQLGLPYARERRRLFAGDSALHLAEVDDPTWGLGATLLLGGLRPELVVAPEKRSGVAIGSELASSTNRTRRRDVIESAGPLDRVLRRVAGSALVVTSSPSLLAVAEALGVPASAVRPDDDPDDATSDAITAHYDATGRDPADLLVGGLDDALERGGAPAPAWDPHPLLDAFPAALWGEHADPTILAAIGWRARLAISTMEEAPRTRVEP